MLPQRRALPEQTIFLRLDGGAELVNAPHGAAGVALQLSKDDLKAARYDFPWTHNEYPIDNVPHTPPAGAAGGAGQSGTTTETTTTRAQAMAPATPAPRFSSLDG